LKIILERCKPFEFFLKIKLVTGNWLLPIGNRLRESNHSGILENLRKFFCKTKLCYLIFEKKSFNTYPIWSLDLLLLDVFSWILDWILDAWSWSLESIIWDFGIIKIAWFIIMKLASTMCRHKSWLKRQVNILTVASYLFFQLTCRCVLYKISFICYLITLFLALTTVTMAKVVISFDYFCNISCCT